MRDPYEIFHLAETNFLMCQKMGKLAISLNQVLLLKCNFLAECQRSKGTNEKLTIVATAWRNQGKFWEKIIILYSLLWPNEKYQSLFGYLSNLPPMDNFWNKMLTLCKKVYNWFWGPASKLTPLCIGTRISQLLFPVF